jgi:ketosteroid isomerase-like protein
MLSRNGLIALSVAAALALTLSGCDKGQNGSGQSASSVTDAVKADETKWNAQFKSKDFDGLIAHYADDAFFAAPGTEPASGSTEIRKVYATALSDPNFAVSFASDRIDSSGDLAYSRGHFSETYTDKTTGKVMAGEGTYITVYKKQADGSWKAVEDITASGGAPKPVPSAKPATRAKMVSM